MARTIVARWQDEESEFAFTKVEREKVYGRKQRVVVDESGRTCQSAWLTADGSALVPTGGTAHVWMDERWDAVASDARRAVDVEGTALEVRPSTLGTAQEARLVPPSRVLELVTSAVYQLAPEDLSPVLAAALGAGSVFELTFRFRDGYEDDAILLLQNDEGLFALVGRPTGFELLARDATPTLDADDSDELEGDLDFAML